MLLVKPKICHSSHLPSYMKHHIASHHHTVNQHAVAFILTRLYNPGAFAVGGFPTAVCQHTGSMGVFVCVCATEEKEH